jgi:hypothetical protein
MRAKRNAQLFAIIATMRRQRDIFDPLQGPV